MSHFAAPGGGPEGWRDRLADLWVHIRAYRLHLPRRPTERMILGLALATFIFACVSISALLIAHNATNEVHSVKSQARGDAQAQQGALSTANSLLTQAGIPAVPTPSVSYTPLPGPPGPTGPPGDTGNVGQSGSSGAAGRNGENGSNGAVGPSGPSGPGGPPGAQGDQGQPGLQGQQGAQGPQGDVGPQGAQGPQGVQGAAGAPPQSFSFQFLGITYVCTPDGDAGSGSQPSYTCTPQQG